MELNHRQRVLCARTGLSKKVFELAAKRGIEPSLLCAIIMQESDGRTDAARYEKGYKWTIDIDHHAKDNFISKATEEIFQQTSWGLGQIMGATARELGFQGPLTKLLRPEVGASWAVEYLVRLFDRYSLTEEVVSSYNQGSPRRDFFTKKFENQKYVDGVYDWIAHFSQDDPETSREPGLWS